MSDKEARTTFTTTLPVSVLLELDQAAEATHRKKNDILTRILQMGWRSASIHIDFGCGIRLLRRASGLMQTDGTIWLGAAVAKRLLTEARAGV